MIEPRIPTRPKPSPAERYTESLYANSDAAEAVQAYWQSLGGCVRLQWAQAVYICEALLSSPTRQFITPSGHVWRGDPRRGNLAFYPRNPHELPPAIALENFLYRQGDPTA